MINYDLSTVPFERISTNGNLDFSISYRKKKENYYNDIHDYYSKQNMGFRISVSNGKGSKTITRKDLSSPFENIFYLPSCGIFENVFVVLMGRMILITPRAARVIIQKKTLDKWPCWHDTCQTARKKSLKK